MNLDKAFGELRSLIHGDLEPQAWSARAWALIQQAHAFDQSHYEAIWRPYLEAFNRWDVPLGAVRSIEKLEEAIAIAPFACFALRLELDDLERSAIADLIKGPSMDHVGELNCASKGAWVSYSRRGTSAKLGKTIAFALHRSKHLSKLTRITTRFVNFGQEDFERLFSLTRAENLRTIELFQADLSASWPEWFETFGHPPSLTHLTISPANTSMLDRARFLDAAEKLDHIMVNGEVIKDERSS